jgi:hypothetical protein
MRKIKVKIVTALCLTTVIAGCASQPRMSGSTQDLVVIESPSGTVVKKVSRIPDTVDTDAGSYVLIEDEHGTSAKAASSIKTDADRAYEMALTRSHRMDRLRLGPGDWGDMGTTAYGLWTGVAEEANPVLAPFGDAVPVVGLPLKYGLKKFQVNRGHTPAQANSSVESIGAIGTCANIATVSGAAMAPALAVGGVCWATYKHMSRVSYEKATAHRLNGTVIPREEWIAKYGND